jgi:hypothetical protein
MRTGWSMLAAVPIAAAGFAVIAPGDVAGSSSAGRPTPMALTLCGTGMVGADHFEGQSQQDHPSSSAFMATQEPAGTTCTADNSSAGSNTWKILHSNVDVSTERGTEHGLLMLSSSSREAGFQGHITDYDLESGGDACTDSNGRSVFYQSGTETDCAVSFGPVGNFNTHGGAEDGQHFRGRYGTIIFQQNSNNHTCDVGSMTYCIQVDLSGQTN